MNRLLRKLWYCGRSRRCPVCGSSVRRFKPYGLARRPDAQCPVCGSLERHRFVWLFLTQRTGLCDGRPKRLLHLAPEPELERCLRRTPALEYVSADLFDPRAMLKMDIAQMGFDDSSFDMVYCSHVLEHVPDDRKAISEIRRVLKKDGVAVILVPITARQTFEDPSVTDPRRREELFGQDDHVRKYGPDFSARLAECGFNVETVCVSGLLSKEQSQKLGLARLDENKTPIYVCTKKNS
ncbi:MAG: methyltransferase domain-containing protein [Planctomycetaceae bacterium]|nr:methyltransferase domain-containing protein [Planctomycetaceae bacterium]